MTVKAFVLDTNVLLHSAQSIESFHDNDVVIPMAVVEELDKFKKNSDELGRNARQVIRRLDKLRQAAGKPGQLRRGVPLSAVSASATGRLFVLSAAELGNGEMDSKIREVFRLDLGGDSAGQPDSEGRFRASGAGPPGRLYQQGHQPAAQSRCDRAQSHGLRARQSR